MVAGDLVNTASRIQSAQRSRERYSSARRRSGRRRLRSCSRTPGRTSSRARPSRSSSGERSGHQPARRSGSVRRGSSRRSSGATASSGSSRSSSTQRPRTAIAPRLGRRHRRHRQVAPFVGVREVHRRARRRHLVALGALSRLRRRRRVLGACRDGSRPRAESSRTRRRALRREKLRAAVEEHIPDPAGAPLRRAAARPPARTRGKRGWRPGEPLRRARACSSSASQRLDPTVLVFEDIHWADSALLDFIEYLLDWSRDVPLFVLTLRRPELPDRRPTWGAGKRNFTSIFLEPLSPDAMETLLTGPVPGLSDELRARILERAEGVPLLRGRDRADAPRPRCARTRGQRLSARPARSRRSRCRRRCMRCIAARLDGLTAEERRIVQDAAVLGRSFTLRGLSEVSGLPEARARAAARSARAQGDRSSLQSDPLSPERGQYGFLQDLVKKVAYDTLSRRERKTLHLAAAEHLRSLGDEDEIVEVVAAHYLDAYRAAPDDADADEHPRDGTRDARPGRRASRVARRQRGGATRIRAGDRALRRPGGTSRAPRACRGSWRTSARGPRRRGRTSRRRSRCFDEAGDDACRQPGSRRASREIDVGSRAGSRRARADGPRVRGCSSQEEPDADLADARGQLGRFMFFAGQPDVAMQRIESASSIAEALALPETFSQALNTKAIMLVVARADAARAIALLRYALEIALEHDKPSAGLRAYYNLADCSQQCGPVRRGARRSCATGSAYARRVGNRYQELLFLGQSYPLFALGKWDDVLEWASAAARRLDVARQAFSTIAIWVTVNIHKGRFDDAERWIGLLPEFEDVRRMRRSGRHMQRLSRASAWGGVRPPRLFVWLRQRSRPARRWASPRSTSRRGS